MVAPSAVAITRLECPRFGNGKIGLLWMLPLTGQVVCLPRGVNGKGFGLVRKNRPRAKPVLSAADGKLFTKAAAAAKRVKTVAGNAGFTCKTKGSR